MGPIVQGLMATNPAEQADTLQMCLVADAGTGVMQAKACVAVGAQAFVWGWTRFQDLLVAGTD
jgi:meiotically up-regulated gene 157 (Mug157) protein